MSKSVLITGATRGLGEGLARQFADRGFRVALTGRDREELERLRNELVGGAEKHCVRTLDVVEYENVAPALRECAEQLGGLDIVVVNAGVAMPTEAGSGSLDGIRKTIDVNLTGAITTAEAAIKLFREQGRGQLVGITSIAKLRGMKRQSAYCATKAAFSTYLESVRCDTFGEPITVTELAPGYIDTDLNRSLASRPFLVSAEKGTGVMVDLIERRVNFSYVPPWPWKFVALVMKRLPTSRLRTL